MCTVAKEGHGNIRSMTIARLLCLLSGAFQGDHNHLTDGEMLPYVIIFMIHLNKNPMPKASLDNIAMSSIMELLIIIY